MRHESDSKDNTYWLGMLTHLQAPSVSRKVKSFVLYFATPSAGPFALLPKAAGRSMFEIRKQDPDIV
jgi:hypothetical protein